MNKAGVVYRYIAEALLKNRKANLVERNIARMLAISPNTVSRALAPLERIGSVQIYRTYFNIYDWKKLLLFWAVNRKIERDIIYKTYSQVRDISKIEDRLPGEIAYTSFSAYVKNFGNDAAGYSEVYAYAPEATLKEIMQRFPPMRGPGGYSNLIILKPDYVLEKRIADGTLVHSSVPLPQLYVDLWNNNTWYAYEFMKKLEPRIGDAYAKALLDKRKD
jgi:DNA-binding Lrp family transcriptional regulator